MMPNIRRQRDQALRNERFRDYGFGIETVFKNVALIAALFFVNRLGAPGNLVFFGVLIYFTAKSHQGAVKSLSILFLVIVGNTALVNTGSIVFSVLKLGFILFVFAKFATTKPLSANFLKKTPLALPLLVFCSVSFALALSGGYFVHISTLKLISFFAGAASIFAAVEVMKNRPHQLDSWFFSMIIFIMLVGVFTYFAGIGFNSKTDYARFDRLFNGPFYHPQTLGPACALITLWLFNFAVLSRYRRRYWALSMIPFFLGFAYLSSSRTSLATIAFSVLIAFIALLFAKRTSFRLLKKITGRFLIAGLIATIALVFVESARPGSVLQPTLEFVTKSNDPDTQFETDNLLQSRQGLLDMMAQNIEDKPLTGIGFGTSTHRAFVRSATWYRATTEKGFLPMAIIEETGIIGAMFFLIFIIAIFRYFLREGNITGLTGFAALLGVNLGEMSFFSFGGHGGFFWIWVMALMLMMPSTLPMQKSRLRPKKPRSINSNPLASR